MHLVEWATTRASKHLCLMVKVFAKDSRNDVEVNLCKKAHSDRSFVHASIPPEVYAESFRLLL